VGDRIGGEPINMVHSVDPAKVTAATPAGER